MHNYAANWHQSQDHGEVPRHRILMEKLTGSQLGSDFSKLVKLPIKCGGGMGKWALKIATVRPVQTHLVVAPSRLKKASWPERSAGLACK